MKKTYINPEMEIIQFEAEDIMNLSGGVVTYNSGIQDTANAYSDLWNSQNDW